MKKKKGTQRNRKSGLAREEGTSLTWGGALWAEDPVFPDLRVWGLSCFPWAVLGGQHALGPSLAR